MDNDLNRSVRMLEESLTPRGKTLLLIGTPTRERTKSKQLNTSSLAPDLRHIFEEELTAGSIHESSFTSALEANKTLTGSILRVNEPWKTTVNSLYMEFYEVLQTHTSGHDVIEIVADLARCCSDALMVIRSMKSKMNLLTLSEEVWLENERNTWRLLYVMYQDRLTSQNSSIEKSHLNYGVSEKLCITNLFKTDVLIRESQLVIDWLEHSASERDVEALHFTDSCVGWENTLHQLQSIDTIVFESSKKIVSSLHPDAPHFENLPLHDLDAEDDTKLCQRVFQLIRCGKLEQAKTLCRSCGHVWRAAILEGWRLFHNPNLAHDYTFDEKVDMDVSCSGDPPETNAVILKDEDLKQTEGNANRDIWKAMAHSYCEKVILISRDADVVSEINLHYLNPYEKASMAAYCGNSEALLPVCKNWEDYLWAYMRVMVDIRVESEIRDNINREYTPLPEAYWNQKMSLNEVFKKLESSSENTVLKESRMPDHMIQKYVILDDIHNLMESLGSWIDESELTTQFVRFAAHLVLFLEQIGQTGRRDVAERVLELYVSKLAEMNETNLVTYYISKLGLQKQVYLYASYLERILDNQERKEALVYAEGYGLNTQEITKQVVENIRSRPHEVGAFGDLQQRVTEVDTLKISAIDWLLIYENQRLEALEQSNALIFTFLTLKKLDAAQLTFNKIPFDSVDSILSEGELLPEMNQIIKEHLSYRAYLDAHEAFNDWFKQFNSRPIPPEPLSENAQFTEKVAHQHRESQYKADTERWKLSTTHLAKTAKNKLYNVLLFPDGGWLNGAKDGDFLRSTCIPEITLLLYSVLFESGYHEECIQLADILASEKYGLYKVFSKEKLGDVLVRLGESSVALLNEKKDCWGNVTTE